ncbi:MAG: WbuC family cupin fold metalloprotein [Candidatus Omnitrophica bacterium]|nr:WbuC family cupin fold metalloprotein [Candidatus Omnitrophota bacterium]
MRKVSDEVFYLEDRAALVGRQEVEFLKGKVGANGRRRIRFCAHQSPEDPVHEMFVTLTKESYIRPHKHLSKSESFHIIEGSVDLVIFDEAGDVVKVIPLADRPSGGSFYFRFTESSYHTLHITSDFLVFHETTSGPFKPSDTLFAPWSPEEPDRPAVGRFMNALAGRVERFVSLGRKS